MTERSPVSHPGQPQMEAASNGTSDPAARPGRTDPAAYPGRTDPVARLAGTIAHHFNNLLTVIDGNAWCLHNQMLEEGRDPRLEIRLREIRAACRRGAELTSQLLFINGSHWAEPLVMDLRDFVKNLGLGELFSGEVVFCTDFTTSPCPVRADPVHLKEAVIALAMNSREALGDRGAILIGIDRLSGSEGPGGTDGGWIRLEVSDSGEGMSAETLARALEPYFTTRCTGDTRGLGLPIADGIVRRAGGRIELKSSPGEGTTVSVWLPAVPDPGPAKTQIG